MKMNSNINNHSAMTKDIPEIDDLTKGINDPDIMLSNSHQETSDAQDSLEAAKEQSELSVSLSGNIENCWQDFLSYLDTADQRDDKNERLVCKLDRDLADSLDDCDIQGRCRSDLVNAIVRAFFGAFLPQFARYRREKKSLFTNYKEA